MEEQKQKQGKSQNINKKQSSDKTLVIVLIVAGSLLVLAAVFMMVVFGYIFYKAKMGKISSSPNQSNVSEENSKNVYINNDYGFRLKMTDSWKNYKVDVKQTDGGYGAAKIDFYLPSQGADYTDIPGYVNLFTINAYYIERWSEYQDFCQTAMCAGEEIGRNQDYVFTYYHINGFPPDDVPEQAISDMENIIKEIEVYTPNSGYESASNAYSSVEGNLAESATSPESRPAYNFNFASNSDYYYNCKYRYMINYPTSWSTENATSNSIQVFFIGPSAKVKVESLGLIPGQSLNSFADERTSLMEGNLAFSETIDWDGTLVVRSWFTHPDSQSMHWIAGSRGMELMAFGTGYNSQFTKIENMLGTLLINSTPSECSSSSASSSSSQSFDCSSWNHPNGDIEYWWDTVTEAERQCYISKYGYPPMQ
jgi:hypothetical protein